MTIHSLRLLHQNGRSPEHLQIAEHLVFALRRLFAAVREVGQKAAKVALIYLTPTRNGGGRASCCQVMAGMAHPGNYPFAFATQLWLYVSFFHEGEYFHRPTKENITSPLDGLQARLKDGAVCRYFFASFSV